MVLEVLEALEARLEAIEEQEEARLEAIEEQEEARLLYNKTMHAGLEEDYLNESEELKSLENALFP